MTTPFRLPAEAPSRDPVSTANDAYAADGRPHKVNLGIGVYLDGEGRIPLLHSVRLAEERLLAEARPHAYLPIEGLETLRSAVQGLILGVEADDPVQSRALTLQTLGGTGALRLAADFLRQTDPQSTVYVSDPTWDNHRAIFAAAGFDVARYPYYADATHDVRLDAMLEALSAMKPRSIVVLHACCHNPTGADLTDGQWDRVVTQIVERDLIAVCDMAYQGFAVGLAEDRYLVQRLLRGGCDFLVATSMSKSFSLYGERIGSLTVMTASREHAARVAPALKRIVRSSYSNPPLHGAAIVAKILTSPDLLSVWNDDLTGMRERIRRMRTELAQRLATRLPALDLSFIRQQRGMFSYTGLTPDEASMLATGFAVHVLSTGRICLAALHDGNLERAVTAIASVLRSRSRRAG